jgi:FAD/FMN-containing dehydrogenase
MPHTFKNWSRTVTFTTNEFAKPKSEAEVAQLVAAAAAAGRCVRTQGAGHSFSQILTTNDTLVTLDGIPDTCVMNGDKATVPGGMRLKNLIKALKKNGRGLRNLGSVTEQSIAGAFSTGTHGSGLTLESLCSLVSAMRLVDGHGQVQVITSPADLAAARLSIGTLGIITEVTLDTVPYYDLEYNAYVCRFDDIVDRLDELATQNERALLWWLRPPVGPGDRVIIVTKNPVGAPPGFPANAPNLDDSSIAGLPGGLAFDGAVLGGLVLGLSPAPGRFRRILKYTDGYEKVLTLPLLPVFHREMEYAIPAQHASTALKAVRHVLDEADLRLLMPMEVRFMAPETHLLSPAYDRPQGVMYMGVSPGSEVMDNGPEVFERFEPIMRTLGGRPHWGKHFSLTREDVQRLYPATHDTFVQARRRFDPNGVFLNSLLRQLFE